MQKKEVDEIMLYVHYCRTCNRAHILNGHKKSCPKCENTLKELPVSFLQFVSYDEFERAILIRRLTKSPDSTCQFLI